MKQCVIFLNNALEAKGLSHLLADSFSIQAHIVSDAGMLNVMPDVDLIFTDAITFVANMKGLLPRQTRIIVLSEENIESDGSVTIISYKTLDELTAQLNNLLNRNEATDSVTSSTLSQRETDVLRLVASGCINKEIAERLGISINTVLTHRKNITAKLGIKSVSGLSFYAMMNGIVAPQ